MPSHYGDGRRSRLPCETTRSSFYAAQRSLHPNCLLPTASTMTSGFPYQPAATIVATMTTMPTTLLPPHLSVTHAIAHQLPAHWRLIPHTSPAAPPSVKYPPGQKDPSEHAHNAIKNSCVPPQFLADASGPLRHIHAHATGASQQQKQVVVAGSVASQVR